MKKYQPFSFRGCGYVQDLALNDQDELGLQIEVIQIQPNDCPDTITLDCTVLPALQEKIRQLNLKRPYTEGVRIEFEVVFRSFGACYSTDRCHAGQLVLLQCELEAVKAWERDPSVILPAMV